MELRKRAVAFTAGSVTLLRTAKSYLSSQFIDLVDKERWRSGVSWRDRLHAVSWPRATVLAGLTAAAGMGIWLSLQPAGIEAHPPRLPTEEEWAANQAAGEAFEGNLSPALAAANRTEPSRAPK